MNDNIDLDLQEQQAKLAVQKMLQDGREFTLNQDGQYYDNLTGMPVSREGLYGSNTRYNQLQNFPHNMTNQSGENMQFPQYSDRQILNVIRPNNISDIAALERRAYGEQGLYDFLSRLFNGEGTGSIQNADITPQRYKRYGQY